MYCFFMNWPLVPSEGTGAICARPAWAKGAPSGISAMRATRSGVGPSVPMAHGPVEWPPPSVRLSREGPLPLRPGPLSRACGQPTMSVPGLRTLLVSLGQVPGSVHRTGHAALRSAFGEIVPGGATLV